MGPIFKNKNLSFAKIFYFGMYLLSVMLITACGGGGGSPGTTGAGSTAGGSGSSGSSGSASANGSIQIVLMDASGSASNSVTGSSSLVAKATVTTSTGAPAKNVVVTFELSNAIAVISPASGTALTDANGIAQVSVKSAGAGSGATEITAKATVVGTTEISAKTAFSVGAAAAATPTAINFVTAVPSDKSIVIKGAGGNGRTEVALLTFSVVDNTNSGVPNVPVTFTTQSTNPVTLVSSVGTTDINGNVSVALNSGTMPTTVRVVATVQGTSISAISDTVTVTTGQPVQTAFSMALEKYFVEGLNYDNTQNKVTVLLADSNGAAVADGTPVVFTTTTGAIVGDGGAKCLTVNGECTVNWRSQDPRNANGVGTIVATSTNGSENLSVSRNFYISGSYATVYQVTGLAGATVRLTSGGPLLLDFSTSCDPQTFEIEVVDANDNPMPDGTVISGANASNASLSVVPSTIAYTGNLYLNALHRGTVHNVTVTPAGCKLGGTSSKSGEIYISVKTPLGGETFTRISLGTFPAN
ncbi:hypothetical protein [Noviherbaspirillum autotrophicum]|uniref:hypothetical protein n=1 Tax=Noviherbaspirillum autotrophicum TaxID=709839 RepID=UPI000B0538B7|nr:hypothetical protein [Noviherbaspirillum autotrophicum]